jgi:hypothetical protein
MESKWSIEYSLASSHKSKYSTSISIVCELAHGLTDWLVYYRLVGTVVETFGDGWT